MALTFLYWAFRRLLEFVVLTLRSERAKEIELVVLRHQLSVLRCEVGGPPSGLACLMRSKPHVKGRSLAAWSNERSRPVTVRVALSHALAVNTGG
jgi:hypothetical protein